MEALKPEKAMRVTQEDLRKYAEASGDDNQIHLDEAVAKKAGLPGVIAHGMLSAGLLAERAMAARDALFPEFKLRESQYRFKAMTLLGDEIWTEGTASVEGASLTLQLKAVRQPQNEMTTLGTFKFSK